MDGRQAHAREHPIEVTRTVRLNAVEFADALVGLRREMTGGEHRFHLAALGTFEVDGQIVTPGNRAGYRSSIPGRLWSNGGDTVAPVDIEVVADSAVSFLTLRSRGDLPQRWQRDIDAFFDLARAALDELCEELLFHAAARDRRA